VLVKRFRQIRSVLVARAAVSAVFDRREVVAAPTVEPFPIEGFKTPSGLVYFDMNAPDLQPTSNNSSFMYPAYGQFVSFYFTSYYLPSAEGKLQFIDATEPGAPFLQKHGNGRIIRGIEEALHTMTVGSRRRVIIPAQLGYSTFGLGPLPMEPSRRRKLGEVIGKVDRGEGSLVYDLELVHIRDDVNDMGYYSDIPVSKEEVRDYVFRSRNITIPTTASVASVAASSD
jgi:peptidylprolyl isomerase